MRKCWQAWLKGSWESFVKYQLRVAGHEEVFQFTGELIAMPAIELLRTVVERRHEQEEMAAVAVALLGEGHQLRSDALPPRFRTNSDTSNVRRAREAVRRKQDEAEG